MGMVLDEPDKNERTIQINGTEVLISDEVKSFSKDNIIDYLDESYSKGFIIHKKGDSSC